MPAVQVHIDQGTEEWHLWRKSKLGASDTSALFDESPYKTVRDLWFEKSGLGEAEDEDRSYIFQRGHETEADIRHLFSKHTKIDIQPTCFENGIFGCSLDGYDKGLGILEAKLVGRDVLAKIAKGEIPEHHRIQVQTQLHGSDSDKAYYGAKAPHVKTGQVVEIGRDEKLIKQIIKKGEAFWESVAAGIVPKLTDEDTLFISDPKQVALVLRLRELKGKMEALGEEYDELDKLVKAMSTHPKVRCGDALIAQIKRSGSIDYLKIPEVKALADEYLEQFRKRSTTYKSIRFVKGA